MRITDVDIWTVVVPVLPGRVNSPAFGTPTWPQMPKQILRVRTDDGHYGLGETARGCPRAAVEAGAEALVGLDPLRLPLQELPLVRDEEQRHGPRAGYEGLHGPGRGSPAYDAFEMALYDLVGRALGLPAHYLLGGALRELLRGGSTVEERKVRVTVQFGIFKHLSPPMRWPSRGGTTLLQ